ncbi:MAG: response regulator [Desulfobacter postgatei]|jgi:DNA-binding NtrC family response regulator|uniref:response regulator n=1 Tax=Desulfobacter TaxID=2289 RepID=UPI001B43BD99|nr:MULTISPECIES: response regulator [Desulfobacter]MDQ1271311.1 two-component system, OmpR family, response regulator [Thermodesulfobacteriota bacterium]MBP8829202.1 response regulator [Desulfobacter sp.]MBP9598799.1 response regulator [Desulfobacter sp.]MDD4274291.1 response regulator [Desulfobacter postgatei]HRF89727.1 response regulator [Desulfobacter postgatei]
MSEKVLIIDDEQEFTEALAERMTNRGMTVSTSSSAIEGLQSVEEQSFDVVVLDLQMPEMDGIETLKILKKKRPELQVILLTGHATVEKGIEAMKLGAMDLLEKPADMTTLTEKIKKAQAKKMILVEKKSEERIKEIIESRGW